MKKIRSILFLLAVVLLGAAGCKKTDFIAQQQANSTTLKLGDFIQNNFQFKIFTAALTKTGLMDTLNNTDATYTAFVPSDAAFAVDSILSVADLEKLTVDSLRYIVRSHIIQGRLFKSDIPLSLDNQYANLNGETLYISSNTFGFSFYVSGSPLTSVQTATNGTTYDIPLANGVLHIIGRPVKYWRGTVQDFLAHRPELSTFVTGLKRFGIWDSLGKASSYTVFAPVNDDFTKNGIVPDSVAGMDTAHFQPILFNAYTVRPHHIFYSDPSLVANVPLTISGGYQLNLGNNGFLVTSPTGVAMGPLASNPYAGDRYIPILNTGSTDYCCANGIVHLIGNLLVLPSEVRK